jgi:predicted alpha/beta-hydrolase family hydrolase
MGGNRPETLQVTVRRTTLALDDPAVEAVDAAIHEPDGRITGPAVLLAPGAGGDLDGQGLVALADVLADLGRPTVRVNLPHHQAGRRAAPRASRSVAPYRQLVAAARAEVDADGLPWIVGGKSYGGRVASMAVAEGLEATGLLFYGYPLHPPGKPENLRVDHWPNVGVPSLFLQGERDTFCDLELLETQVRKLPRRATIHVVPGGDHSLHVPAAASPSGRASNPTATIGGLRDVVGTWLRSLGD